MSTSNTRGYPVKNKDQLDRKYICQVCDYVLRTPFQLNCGDRICQTCIEHLNNLANCLICGSKIILSEVIIDKGFQRDMQKLEVACTYSECTWLGQLITYQQHLEEHRARECEYCQEIFSSQSLLEEHRVQSCLKKPMDCFLQRYGCKEQFLRGDREKHYMSENHQTALLFGFDQIGKQFTEQWHTQSAALESTMELETSDVLSKVTTTATTSAATDKFIDDIRNLKDTVSVISNGVQSLKDELTSVDNESVQQSQSLEATEKILSTTQTSIEESNNLLTAMTTNVRILQQDVTILKQKYDDQQVSSYDGVLVWKISRFQEKMTDAKSERQVSIYSPPFRSSTTGYTMRARLYPYGDGNARRTHMSLFFVLMRGPHDSILTFPFSYKVTFCLYDQTSQRSHIIDSFRPDTKSNSFQRPRSDMNIASGIPKFVPLTTIDKPDNPYVKNDTIFIKVLVDFENMPKAILPFALSLNPGIPTHAQYKLIRQEMEKIPQQSPPTAQVPSTVGGSGTKKK